MAVATVTVINKSPQVIKILYGTIAKASSASTILYNKAGQLGISPGGSISIELDRVDLGQLDSLQKKNLITYSIYGD
jgi:hypothetical protein